MMKKSPLVMVILCLFNTGLAGAANLTQFTAGQPAKAAEVNANFKALNDELTALKSFNNLTNEQVAALKAAIQSKGLRWVEQSVDCTNNPKALMDLVAAEGAGLVYMGLKLKGDCQANLTQQIHSFTLNLYADQAEPARLIPDGNAWSLSGGFNGGLYLTNLTLQPPADKTAVIFSRVSQGSIDNSIIEGGANGVIIQAGAQAYISNTQIKNTQHNGIRVMSGGNLRLFHTLPNTKLVDTNSGNGIVAEQAEIGLGTSVAVKAPQAVLVQAGGSFAQIVVAQTPNRLTAEGNVTIYSGGQLHAQELVMSGNLYAQQAAVTTAYLDLTGNLSLHDNASLFSNALKLQGQTFLQASTLTVNNNSDITGKINAARGSHLTLKQGVLRALNPTSFDYQQSIALELVDGASVFLGDYREPDNAPPSFVLNGQLQLSQSALEAHWITLNGGLYSEASSVSMQYSTLNAPGRGPGELVPVNLVHNSTLVLRHTDLFTNTLNALSSTLAIHQAELGSSKLTLSQRASADLLDCSGSGFISLDSSQLNAHNCQMGDATLYGGLNSVARFFGGQMGLVHLDFTSNAAMSNMTLTGNGQMSWGDSNYNIGANSMMTLQNVTVNKTKHFNNNGVLRITDNSALSGSTIFCSEHAYWQLWNQTTATFGESSSCN